MNTQINKMPHKSLYKLFTNICLVGLLPLSQVLANTLNEVSYSTLPGDKVQIRLGMSEETKQPTSFTIDNPARIAFDFPDTTVDLKNKTQEISVGVARSITAIQAGNRTRVVINLANLVGYETVVNGNEVLITLNDKKTSFTQGKAESTVTVGSGSSTRQKADIHNLDFRRGSKGEGRVEMTLADPNTPVDMKKRGKQIFVTIKNSSLPDELERRLDVIDFATPVTTVDAFNNGNDVRIIITAANDFDHISYQADEKLTIDVKPIIKVEDDDKKKRRKFPYTGERLSLNFQNIEVRAVLQLIADFTGINMVTSDTVGGNLTLRLKNVPWDQALDVVLKTKGLAKRTTGNVMLIAPTEEIAAREKLELEAVKQVNELAPLVSDSIQINYAKAADLADLIKSKDKSLLSPRGSVAIDERTNKLLVLDTSDNIDEIINLVEELDIAVRQVLIESRIVLAGTNFSKELGVKFGVSGTGGAQGTGTTTSGNLDAASDWNTSGVTPPLNDRLNVDLPVVGAAGSIGIAMAKLPFGTLLDLELSASQAEGKSETISSPRVITANQHEAVIETGQEIPYLAATSSGATNVQFKKAVLSLTVTPQITPDDRIIMDLKVTNDKPDFGNEVLGTPPIDTNRVETQVLVDNGETIVLGGVYERVSTTNITRVPFFGDLPLVGVLFRQTEERDEKTELLMFVTPKLIKQNVSL